MRIHDRYILASFWRNLTIGLIAFTVIFITVDINEEIDNYLDHDAALRDVAVYYFFQIPWVVMLVLPVSVLLAAVFTLGKLARQNELTAFIASGTPLLRVAAPIIASALFLSVASIVCGEIVVPLTNRQSDRIMLVRIEKRKKKESFRFKNNLHYEGENNRLYYAERYDATLHELRNAVIQEYDGSSIRRRIDAQKVFWDGEKWIFLNGAIREFTPAGERISPFDRLAFPELPEMPEDLAEEEIDPEEMNFRELRNYIEKVRRGGGEIDKYLVDLYFKFSFPFTSLIFALIGSALSSAKRKPSLATGFGLTLFVSFTYYGILRIGQALGHSGVIEPLLGAWMGNVIFFALSGVLLYRANR